MGPFHSVCHCYSALIISDESWCHCIHWYAYSCSWIGFVSFLLAAVDIILITFAGINGLEDLRALPLNEQRVYVCPCVFMCIFLEQKFMNVMNKRALFSRVWELSVTFSTYKISRCREDVVLPPFNQHILLSLCR